MSGADHFDADLEAAICRAANADAIRDVDVVQTLWSDYGQLVRCYLDGADSVSVIIKHVRWPNEHNHPRGWATDRSHQRKMRSYQVETTWYQQYSNRCPTNARVPQCLAVEARADEVLIVMEDLDNSGFAGRRLRTNKVEIDACLAWLASFHATFMGERPDGLWETGTYWHLATRPDELAALDDGPLKHAAAAIEQRLADSPFQTLVHGDAKLANFCFSADGCQAAAVDFQYVGGGCGMKDVAYLISSCLDEDESEAQESALLDHYFTLLARAVEHTGKSIDVAALEADWRALYPVAWTDFTRFLHGWSPGHWKLNHYSEQLSHLVLKEQE